MTKEFENINKALNIKSDIVSVSSETSEIEVIEEQKPNESDIKRDYEYSRAQLYSLIEKGQSAIDGIMDLADSGGSPRAYEVAGQLIKSVGDVTDKLIDLQKKLKEVEENVSKTTNNVTNNALFVGSTAELQKLLKQGFLNNKEK